MTIRLRRLAALSRPSLLLSLGLRSVLTLSPASIVEAMTVTSSAKLPALPPLPIKVSDLRESHGFSDKAHWVIPNVLMQGTRPGFGLDVASDPQALPEQVRALVEDAGIRAFVSAQAEAVPEEGSGLLGGNGGTRKDVPKDLPPYAAHVPPSVADGVRFSYFGILGMQPASSTEGLADAVAELHSEMTSGAGGGPTYVHCGGGVGRAGLVCACLLGMLYPELSADEAIEYTTGLCYLRCEEGSDAHYSSPETDGQKEQVREVFARMRAVAAN